MTNKPMECGNCKEITLRFIECTDSGPYIETWECSCGQISCFHVAKPSKYPGFDEFYHSIDPDDLDAMCMTERMQLAFNAGRSFECKDTIKKLKPLQDSIAGLENSVKRQA